MPTFTEDPTSFIGLRLDDEDIARLINEQEAGLSLAEDRFQSNVVIFSDGAIVEAKLKTSMEEIKECLYQVWEGIGGEVVRALKFDVYASEEHIDLVIAVEASGFSDRKSESFRQLGVKEPSDPLPTHTVVPCERWSKTWAGLAVPDNFDIGIEGVSVFTLQSDGERIVEDIL